MDVCLVRMHPPFHHIYLSHCPPNAHTCILHAFWLSWTFGYLKYDMARTHSIMRIATTASPVSGAEVSQRTPGSVFMANIFIFIHPYPSSIHPSIHSLCQAHTNTCAHTHARAYTHTHTRCATRLLTWPRRPGSRRRWESYRAPVCVQRQPKDLLSTSLTPSLARSLKQSQPRIQCDSAT